jgi:hypothetical protein
MTTDTLWRSTDGGRTWEQFTPKPRSLLGTMLILPGQPWSDGFGNLYRSDPPEAGDAP